MNLLFTIVFILTSFCSYSQMAIYCDKYTIRGVDFNQPVTIAFYEGSVVLPITNYDYSEYQYYRMKIERTKKFKHQNTKYLMLELSFRNGRKAYLLMSEHYIYFSYADLEIMYRVINERKL